ncbi:YdcF family protein [Adhaeribacter rhizoryzae]|nr:YdcF family protein [Adhaeribacter rhizoryzae]
MPIIWILGLFLFGLLTKNQKRGRISLWLSLSLLLLFSNPLLVNEAWLLWEYEPVPLKNIKQYDAGILLTGFTSLEKSPHDRVYTNKGADRLLHTVMLYKKGYINKVLVTGGSGALRKTYTSEAQAVKNLLLLSGVPAADILLEDKSRNTYENAQYTKKMLAQYPSLQRFIVITSAFHMRRSTGCFIKAGVAHDVFPSDFNSTDRRLRPEAFIPDESALAGWHKLLHEISGFIIYKLMGYC